MNESRPIGKFRIPLDIINNDAQTARIILRDCIVVRAEILYEWDAIEYVAMHPDFPLMPPGSELSVYGMDIMVSEIGDGRIIRRIWKL